MGAPGELAPPTPENALFCYKLQKRLIPPLGCTEPTSEELCRNDVYSCWFWGSLNTNLNYAVSHWIIPTKPNILILTGIPPSGVLRMG